MHDIGLRHALLRPAPRHVLGRQGLEYKLGSILASALYQAGESTGQREVLMRAIVSAYSDEPRRTTRASSSSSSASWATTRATSASLSVRWIFINHVTDVPLKTALCNELIDHLQIPAAELVGPDQPCPAAAQGGQHLPPAALPNP